MSALYLALGAAAISRWGSIKIASQIISTITVLKTAYPEIKLNNVIKELDIEATVNTIQMAVNTHEIGNESYNIAREYVIKSLERVKFLIETVQMKTMRYNNSWKQYYKKLSLNKEERALTSEMKILKQRYKRMIDLKLIPTFNPIRTIKDGMKLMDKRD
jgi:hypothetical protein